MADSIIITANVTDGAIINSNVTESTAVTANVVTGAKGDKGDTGATGAAGVVQAVTDGTGIDVDATDPASPIVSLDPASIASLALADSAIQSLSDLSITSTAAELNYTDGVTSAIQTQLDGKSATSHTHTAADTTDFDTEVSNNTDVAANTAARHTHANKTLLDTYSQTEVNLADAVAKKHAHANSAVLDATTASFTTAEETKLSGIAPGATAGADWDTNVSNRPALGTAAAKDIPATGNASVAEVVYGTDTRLTDSRPASDVSAWAKAPTKPTYTKSEVGLSNVDNTSDANKPVSTAQQTALNAKANASDTVNLTGNQTVAGIKTFSSSPIVPTATTGTQAVNKAQMDTADALKVNKAGDTMTGSLRLTSSINPDDYASFIYNGTSNYSIFKIGNFRPTANNTINTIGFFSLNSDGNQTYHSSINAVMTNNTVGAVRSSVNIDRMEGNARINAFSVNENRVLLGSNRVEFGGTANITGTGFPNGVVSAPVGSIYIDTAVTNGASSWIKKSGTGSTGWQVLEGDTGWREISSLLINGWTAGELLLRRVNAQVYIRTEALSASAMTSANVFTLPAGFKAFSTALSTSSERQFLTTATNPAAVWRATTPSSGVLTIQGSTTGLALLYGTLQFTTPDAWPTTLPGTPA